VLFYAWSPPRLVPDASHPVVSTVTYAATLVERAPAWWVQFWGRLGWLEYGAPALFYWLLFGACLLAGGLAVWRRTPDCGLAPFLVVSGATYLALLLAGEYANVRTAGLVVQGRYLLPVSVCLLPLVRQRAVAMTWTLPVLVVVLNVVLAHATIDRYFGGNWSAWLGSLR